MPVAGLAISKMRSRSTSNEQYPCGRALWTRQTGKCNAGRTSIALKLMCDRLQNSRLLSHIGSMLGRALPRPTFLFGGLRHRPFR